MSTDDKKNVHLPYWREYPEIDREFVRFYPPKFGPLSEEDIWKKNTLVFYVHLPFCDHICYSCPYNKFKTKGILVGQYLEVLKKEIANYASRPYIQESEFISGYIGGGTATSLSTEQLADLLSFISKVLHIQRDAQIITETNPVDIDEQKAEMLLKHGITRISVGAQSFDEDILRNIGRPYNPEKIEQTYSMLKKIGFKHVCLDLMYGLPGQTAEKINNTINKLLSLQPESVGFYQYIVIPNSTLLLKIRRGEIPPLPDEKLWDEIQLLAIEKLLSSGYCAASPFVFGSDTLAKRYEKVETYDLGVKGFQMANVTSFPTARQIYQMWGKCGEYLAMGSGAFGYLKDHVYLNEPNIDEYISKVSNGKLPVAIGAYVSPEEKMSRALVFGLRLLRVSRKDFKAWYGVDMMQIFGEKIRQLEKWGLVTLTEEALQVTYPKGFTYISNISKMFYSDDNYKLPQPALTSTKILNLMKKT